MTAPDPFELSDFLRSRVHDLRQPAPLLEFFEVELPAGDPLRYVDFADPDAGGSLPKKVPFNGAEFDSIQITRGDIQDTEEGATQRIPVTIADPLHQAAFFLRAHSYLEGARVSWWLAAYDQLATPADALSHTFRCVGARISEGPPRVTLVLGHPNLYEARLPKYYYDRGRCLNQYHERFSPGQRCTYPSNEFAAQTEQDYRAGGALAVKKRKYGWWTQQATHAGTFAAHSSTAGHLVIASADELLAWDGPSRYGPNLFRPLALGESDFEVETAVDLARSSPIGAVASGPFADGETVTASGGAVAAVRGATADGAAALVYVLASGAIGSGETVTGSQSGAAATTSGAATIPRPGALAGLLCQDEAAPSPELAAGESPPLEPASSWLFWGVGADADGAIQNLRRSTDGGVSTDATSSAGHTHIRMARAGGTFSLSSRSSSSSSWALVESVSLALPARIRIGVVAGTDATPHAGEELAASFAWIRFTAGGAAACTFNLRDAGGCEDHDNVHQFNGFPEIPNDRAL